MNPRRQNLPHYESSHNSDDENDGDDEDEDTGEEANRRFSHSKQKHAVAIKYINLVRHYTTAALMRNKTSGTHTEEMEQTHHTRIKQTTEEEKLEGFRGLDGRFHRPLHLTIPLL